MRPESEPAAETWTTERCYIAELLNDPALPEVSVARCRVSPGVTTELHALSVIEWYLVEAGEGLMRLGGAAPFRVVAGGSVHIPAHREQQVSNTGDSDLLFLCVCVPRFTPGCYRSLE